MHHTAAKFVPRLLTNDQKEWRINMREGCNFALFPKLKIKLKGRRFETVSDIKRDRKQYSTVLRKMTSLVVLKRRKNNGITVYFLKDTILKEMATKIQ
jgi:hypothetical protein